MEAMILAGVRPFITPVSISTPSSAIFLITSAPYLMVRHLSRRQVILFLKWMGMVKSSPALRNVSNTRNLLSAPSVVENVRNIPQLIIIVHIHLADKLFRQIQRKADVVLVITGTGAERVAGNLA